MDEKYRGQERKGSIREGEKDYKEKEEEIKEIDPELE